MLIQDCLLLLLWSTCFGELLLLVLDTVSGSGRELSPAVSPSRYPAPLKTGCGFTEGPATSCSGTTSAPCLNNNNNNNNNNLYDPFTSMEFDCQGERSPENGCT